LDRESKENQILNAKLYDMREELVTV